MITELLSNKVFVFSVLFLGGFLVFKLLTRKSKDVMELEIEYEEIINSDKYRVKGQYE